MPTIAITEANLDISDIERRFKLKQNYDPLFFSEWHLDLLPLSPEEIAYCDRIAPIYGSALTGIENTRLFVATNPDIVCAVEVEDREKGIRARSKLRDGLEGTKNLRCRFGLRHVVGPVRPAKEAVRVRFFVFPAIPKNMRNVGLPEDVHRTGEIFGLQVFGHNTGWVAIARCAAPAYLGNPDGLVSVAVEQRHEKGRRLGEA